MNVRAAAPSHWTNFAKTGDPNGKGLSVWPAYKPEGGGQVIELGKDVAPRSEPHRDRYEFLDTFHQEFCNTFPSIADISEPPLKSSMGT